MLSRDSWLTRERGHSKLVAKTQSYNKTVVASDYSKLIDSWEFFIDFYRVTDVSANI